jgi:hypothetical protein
MDFVRSTENSGTALSVTVIRVRELAGKMTSIPTWGMLSQQRNSGSRTAEAMVAECSNPSCSASFLYLKEGRLFRLERDPTLGSKSNRVEYFWLCPGCSSTMTLRLSEDGTVVTVLIPEPFRGVPEGVALTSVDREKGLLLPSVSSP